MEDNLDKIIGAAIATIVGLALLTSMVIPIGLDMINGMTEAAYSEYGSLLQIVITMCVIGLLVGVIRFYQSAKR